MQFEEAVETLGHLLDSGVLARVLDDVLEYGGDYRIDRLDLGREQEALFDRARPSPAARATAVGDTSMPRRPALPQPSVLV